MWENKAHTTKGIKSWYFIYINTSSVEKKSGTHIQCDSYIYKYL